MTKTLKPLWQVLRENPQYTVDNSTIKGCGYHTIVRCMKKHFGKPLQVDEGSSNLLSFYRGRKGFYWEKTWFEND